MRLLHVWLASNLRIEPVMLCCDVLQALKGGYVEPGPGGDPIRNPSVLPTGKNIHALDPQSIPTQAALKSARIVVERCFSHLVCKCKCLNLSTLSIPSLSVSQLSTGNQVTYLSRCNLHKLQHNSAASCCATKLLILKL